MAQKVWMITGASRGIGAEIARAALSNGEKVIATARDVQNLGHLGGGDRLFAVSMDVTDQTQVHEAVRQSLARFHRIDVLVNNAGFGLLGAVEETTANEVERIYRTNVFGLLHVTRAVLPGMRQKQTGHIINISSLGGYRASAGWGVYCSTKFAVEGLSEALHDELAPLGIHVTVVEPGFFRTDFMDDRSLQKTEYQIADYANTIGKMRDTTAEQNHQQPGNPVKLAEAILLLANAAEPPLRLPLGIDALQRLADKNDFVEQEIRIWRILSESTSF